MHVCVLFINYHRIHNFRLFFSSLELLLLFVQRSSHAASPVVFQRADCRVRMNHNINEFTKMMDAFSVKMDLRHATVASVLPFRWFYLFLCLPLSAYANIVLWFMLLFGARFNFHYSCFTSRCRGPESDVCSVYTKKWKIYNCKMKINGQNDNWQNVYMPRRTPVSCECRGI